MSSVLKLINELTENADSRDTLTTDINYIRKSAMLVNDALQKGSDIMQMPNGDVIITEVKTLTYKYVWNKEKNRFERVNSGSRSRKRRVADNDDE